MTTTIAAVALALIVSDLLRLARRRRRTRAERRNAADRMRQRARTDRMSDARFRARNDLPFDPARYLDA